MTTRGVAQAILVDEFIFNGDTSSISTSISLPELDKTNVDSSGMEYIGGLPTWRIVQNGFFAGAGADGMAQELYDRIGTVGTVISHVPDKLTPGSPVYTIPNGFNAALPIDAAADGLITMNGEWASSSGGSRGYLTVYNQEFTSTGGSTPVDFMSAGASGGVAYIFVHTIGGDVSGTSSNSALSVESSASAGGGFEIEGSLTFSGTGAYIVELPSVISQYVRINLTDLGGATSVELSAVVSVFGVTQ